MKKNEFHVLGVMSGTSLDGIDIAQLKFRFEKEWKYKIIHAETFSYPQEWKQSLSEAVFYDDAQLKKLNSDYTAYLAKVISGFIEKNRINELNAVCSHGHTIKHEPQNGFSLQIGNRRELASLINQTVVCDFRVQDVQMGGQGAPLVPIGDELLFFDYDFCLNLGGFANVSTRKNGRRIAYDICPVNTVLNHLAGKLGFDYDKDGKIARSGRLNQSIFEELQKLKFYNQKPPKSLGIEWVNEHIFPILSKTDDLPSALKTYTLHAAFQIAAVFNQQHDSKVLVTGGGAFNSYLMEQIKSRSKNQIIIPSENLVNYKEALIFGFLGILKLNNKINVLKSVTGASEDHSSGVVFSSK